MSLTRTLAQLTTDVRKMADVQGTTALQRHPDADLYDYVNRGIAALYRILTDAIPDQRYLTSATETTVAGTSLYPFSGFTSAITDFYHLVSVDLVAEGQKHWLTAFEMHERPALSDDSANYSGVPFCYRLRGTDIELLPTPGGSYTLTLWYVPTPPQPSSSGTAVETIARLDDFIVWYATKFVATKDKNWDLADRCSAWANEMREEIQAIARSRDKNSPGRIVDEMMADRWGRRSAIPRRWR